METILPLPESVEKHREKKTLIVSAAGKPRCSTFCLCHMSGDSETDVAVRLQTFSHMRKHYLWWCI